MIASVPLSGDTLLNRTRSPQSHNSDFDHSDSDHQYANPSSVDRYIHSQIAALEMDELEEGLRREWKMAEDNGKGNTAKQPKVKRRRSAFADLGRERWASRNSLKAEEERKRRNKGVKILADCFFDLLCLLID